MSMMFPNGSPQPTSANQFITGSQPNYGQGLVNFSQVPDAIKQAMARMQQQRQQQPQPQQQNGQPMQLTPGPGQATSGQAPGGVTGGAGSFNPASFAAGLRKFFTPGTANAAPAAPAQNNAAAFAPGGGAPGGSPAMTAPSNGAGFGGGGASDALPPIPNGAGFGLGPLY